MNKRNFLKLASLTLLPYNLISKASKSVVSNASTFRHVYLNPILKRRFFGFLKIV